MFVAPTYAWRLPIVVEAWIRKTQFEGCKDAYFILTCGDSVGSAWAYAKKLCIEKGLHFRGLAPLLCPKTI